MSEWPFDPPIIPMEARVEGRLPQPPGWAYEPKWDGFRAVAWSGESPRLDSRNAKTLLRYFPELDAALRALPRGTVVDGEVIVVRGGVLDFDALQNRVHPAESRVRKLSRETPAAMVAFDLLALEGRDLRARPFSERRRRLVELAGELRPPWLVTPCTEDIEVADRWFRELESAGFDGLVAKALDRPYVAGHREMIKVKHRRSVDAVVAGYRLHKDGDKVGPILLGLYDEQNELHFVGHCSAFGDAAAKDLLQRLRAIEGPDSFGEHARRPGAESRWSAGKDLSWVPVRPEVVVQVSYDQLTGSRFRHAARFERWRPDKDPKDCTLSQLERRRGLGLGELVAEPE